MATYYIDPIGGNNSNTGLSFSQRVRSMSGAGLSIALGDTVKVIQTALPQSAGVNATFTYNSSSVTLSGAKTTTLFKPSDSWTTSAGTTQTTNSSSKAAVGAKVLTVSTSASTGKIGYIAITANLSAYTAISGQFNIQTSNALGATDYELKLCSDATGSTPIQSGFYFSNPYDDGTTADTVSNPPICTIMYKDTGAALPSGVNSIGIYCNTAPTTDNVIITIFNIVACNAVFNHKTLMGTVNSPKAGGNDSNYWVHPLIIDGTNVTLDGSSLMVISAITQKWPGPTTTSTLYTVMPCFVPATNSGWISTVNYAAANISGGWDTTNMSSQSGWSFISTPSGSYNNYMIQTTFNIDFSTVDSFHLSRFYNCFGPYASVAISNCGISNSAYAVNAVYNAMLSKFNSSYCVCCENGMYYAFTMSCVTWDSSFIGASAAPLAIQTSTSLYMRNVTIKLCSNFIGTIPAGHFSFESCNIIDCGASTINATPSSADDPCYATNCTFDATTPFFLNGSVNTNNSSASIVTLYNSGSSTDHKIYTYLGNIIADTTNRHTASGLCWKMSVTSSLASATMPMLFKLATVAVSAGSSVTISCWLKRDNTGLTVGITCPAQQLIGMASSYSTSMSAVANTYQQVSIVFTPTSKGSIDIFAYAYGGTTFNAWIDDLTVSQ